MVKLYTQFTQPRLLDHRLDPFSDHAAAGLPGHAQDARDGVLCGTISGHVSAERLVELHIVGLQPQQALMRAIAHAEVIHGDPQPMSTIEINDAPQVGHVGHVLTRRCHINVSEADEVGNQASFLT